MTLKAVWQCESFTRVELFPHSLGTVRAAPSDRFPDAGGKPAGGQNGSRTGHFAGSLTDKVMSRLWKNSGGEKFAVAFCLALVLAACAAPGPSGPQPITRVVLIWLKNPSSATDRAQIVRTAQALRMMPGVVKVTTGRAAILPEAATDRSFDLGVIITFRDRAAYARYERDPRHAQAMERFLHPLVQRYEVYNQGVR
ncbi:MAG: Dabb family protein [Chthoniobacterales bacterium]